MEEGKETEEVIASREENMRFKKLRLRLRKEWKITTSKKRSLEEESAVLNYSNEKDEEIRASKKIRTGSLKEDGLFSPIGKGDTN